MAPPSFPWYWNNCHTDHVEIKTEWAKDWVPYGKHREDQSWRRMCWSRTMNLGFVEMGYPLICLGGPSFLVGIAKSQKKAKNLLKVNLNKSVNLLWCQFEVEMINSSWKSDFLISSDNAMFETVINRIRGYQGRIFLLYLWTKCLFEFYNFHI